MQPPIKSNLSPTAALASAVSSSTFEAPSLRAANSSNEPGKLRIGGRPFRSKLIPYQSLIFQELHGGKTFAEVVTLLRIEGIHAAISTVHSFVQVRRKRAGSARLSFSIPNVPSTAASPSAGAPTQSGWDIDLSKPL